MIPNYKARNWTFDTVDSLKQNEFTRIIRFCFYSFLIWTFENLWKVLIWSTLVVGSLACHHWKDLWKRVGAYAAAFCNCNRMNWRASSRNVLLRHRHPSIDEVTLILSRKSILTFVLYFRQIECRQFFERPKHENCEWISSNSSATKKLFFVVF